MFTGIVEELGVVDALEVEGEHARLRIGCRTVLEDADVGDSIAIDGCCLTITSLPGDGFTADLMAETLRATALGDLDVGARCNLERAMAAGDRFGGHLVQGHVDAVGEVVGREEQPGTVWLDVQPPAALARYLVAKGSITVAGVSLTVAEVAPSGRFRLALIPHTLDVTNLADRTVGDRLNLEVDVIAKYVERLLAGGAVSPYVDAGAGDVAPTGAAASTDVGRATASTPDPEEHL